MTTEATPRSSDALNDTGRVEPERMLAPATGARIATTGGSSGWIVTETVVAAECCPLESRATKETLAGPALALRLAR
jgi:hypothetical protein